MRMIHNLLRDICDRWRVGDPCPRCWCLSCLWTGRRCGRLFVSLRLSMSEERLSDEEYGFGFDGRKISSLDSRLNESTSLWWLNLSHKQLDAPNRICQSTQKKKMPFSLGTPEWSRPKTLWAWESIAGKGGGPAEGNCRCSGSGLAKETVNVVWYVLWGLWKRPYTWQRQWSGCG